MLQRCGAVEVGAIDFNVHAHTFLRHPHQWVSKGHADCASVAPCDCHAQSATTPYPCLTEGCTGYVRDVQVLEGPRGCLFRNQQFKISQELEESLQV